MRLSAAQRNPDAFTLSLDIILVFCIRGGVLLVLLTPLIVTMQTYFPFIVGKALFARSVIEAVFGLWLLLALRDRSYLPPRSWVILALGVYLIAAVLAGIAGVSLQRSLWSTYERMQGTIDLTHWFILALLIPTVFRSWVHWQIILNFNLAVSVVVALLGFAQYFEITFITSNFSFLGASARVETTLGNATYVGAFMLVNIFIGLALLGYSYGTGPTQRRASPSMMRSRRRRRHRGRARANWEGSSLTWWRVLWVSAIVLDFSSLWFSGTRGALLGLIAGMLFFGIVYLVLGKLHVLRVAISYLLGALFALIILFALVRSTSAFDSVASSNYMLARISGTGLDAFRGRLTSISAGLQGFADRPVLGWGPENYIVAWGRYFDSASGVGDRFDQAHNKLVEELTTKGLLGLLTYLLLWALMMQVILSKVRTMEPHQQLFSLFMGAALAGYFAQNLFLFDTPATILQFTIMLAFVVSLEATIPDSAAERPQTQSGDPQAAPKVASERSFWRLGKSGGVLSRVAWGFGLVLVLGLVVFTIYIVNYRVYKASVAIVQTADPQLTWDERLEFFRESIDTFPPLANYPRLAMILQVARDVQSLSLEEAEAVLAMIEREGERAIDSEPEGWQLYVAMGQIYQLFSALDPSYVVRARGFVDEAARLAPLTNEVAALEELQRNAEASISSGP